MLFSNREKRDKYIQIRLTETEKQNLKDIIDRLNEDNSKKINLTDFILNAIDYYIEHECKNYKKK
ncbi:hypothetical protein [Clostridioides sp. ZZV15-6597]|uniref:hypothetical protein n=1 Tax=Clostridioides sp. ZZV15-6597 TaxID=2811500 RepID=UPI001D0FC992|nr:hypothetical protein [Clostridioides difficile]MCC0666149.1 hypothetical protein [Clostridioides sp. ZZV15-6597]MCW0822596.1 hypothetical protein [Clostridioides difficile]